MFLLKSVNVNLDTVVCCPGKYSSSCNNFAVSVPRSHELITRPTISFGSHIYLLAFHGTCIEREDGRE